MYKNFTLKDLTDVSTKINLCKIADLYNVSIYTNNLEGEINAYFRIDSCEDNTLGRVVLFSIYSGEQISLNDLTYEEQLVIPDDYFARLKESLSVELEVFGQKYSIWKNAINTINKKHDGNDKFEQLSLDLPIPEFKYMTTPKVESVTEEIVEENNNKHSFFYTIWSKLFKKKNKQDKGSIADN